ncbi:MAG: hypothetical protein JWL96_922 [Sphingomonas bacterium]|uniref:hypothetical protein n=1 Tax=Sphingomonas bacterium TaxID=1895847 RepID=UPI0026137A21|nr:hypothetical protein [Sphingomonas bacterium]MDB5708852.1 hypothetical protein [Sphingomonas bacterium]
MRIPALALLLLVTVPISTTARTPSPARIEATELNRRLLANPSATATLRQWCAEHGIADPVIHAEVIKTPPPAATAAQRRELQVDAREPLGYRRVRLGCAGHVLSEAQNWYVPSRLTPEMNATLDTSDTPFGTVVAPLHISRRNLAAEMLWQHGRKPPPHLFRHRALVLDAGGHPIAEVIETYRREAVALR